MNHHKTRLGKGSKLGVSPGYQISAHSSYLNHCKTSDDFGISDPYLFKILYYAMAIFYDIMAQAYNPVILNARHSAMSPRTLRSLLPSLSSVVSVLNLPCATPVEIPQVTLAMMHTTLERWDIPYSF